MLLRTSCMAGLLALSFGAEALLFDQDVTPDVIFGSGNTNGDFTVDRSNGIELGLRAKIPFVGTINSNGDGTYSYTLAEANPRWNFDWTVNTDYDDSSGLQIASLTYLLGIDFDPSLATDFLAFDPITPTIAAPFFDHSIGTNATGNGDGTEAGDAATYAGLIDDNNVLQQSWRHEFFPFHPTLSYDPTIDGTYDIFLSAFDSAGDRVASTNIQVIIGTGGATIPEPATLALVGAGLAGIGLGRRRRVRPTA
jgi:PEP-CTERM motif